MKTYSQEVKSGIRQKGLTLEAVAKKCRSHKGYISGIVNRKVNPPAEDMTRRLAKVLDLNVDRMLALAVIEKHTTFGRASRALIVQSLYNVCEEILEAERNAAELRKEAV